MKNIETGSIFFLCTFIYFLFLGHVEGQVARTFFDGNDKPTDSTNSYYFKEKKLFGDSLTTSFYTVTNTLRHSEKLVNSNSKELYVKFYYENGTLKSEGNMLYGRPKGKVFSYYIDGVKKSELNFIDFNTGFPNILNRIRIVNYYDSMGSTIIEDGEGYCNCDLEPYSFRGLIEKGKVVAQTKDGLWKCANKQEGYYFEETYNQGLFVKGAVIEKDGREHTYFNFEETAKPKRGMAHFYKEISKVMIYPKAARKKKIQGKVFVQFIIDKEGNITEPKVIKGIGGGCDEVALDAIRKSSKWIPGNQRGRPVKQRYTLPLIFSLGY
jgi:TonB family protein